MITPVEPFYYRVVQAIMRWILLLIFFNASSYIIGQNFSIAKYTDSLVVAVPSRVYQSMYCEKLMYNGVCNGHESGIRFNKQDSFYIYKYEVTNEFYQYFLSDLKKNQPKLYSLAYPDSIVFDSDSIYQYQLPSSYYFREPWFKDFPVTGISYYQCEFFCRWLTDKYNCDPNRKYKMVKIKIPSQKQWETACRISEIASENDKTNIYFENLISTINGTITKNEIAQVNYLPVLDHKIYFSSKDPSIVKAELDEYSSYSRQTDSTIMIAPAGFYLPNLLGVYNLSGNVEEFVVEYGITKGGSCKHPTYYLLANSEIQYTKEDEVKWNRGFRFVMEVIEE